jgi:hypothetical protein
VVKHRFGGSDEATERWVSDGLGLRPFCRLYLELVPDDTTLSRWANGCEPTTRQRLLEPVVALAQALKVAQGRQLRIDEIVGETNSHHLSDSPLRYAGVRVLGRTLTSARHILQATPALARPVFRDHAHRGKRQMKRLMEAARHCGTEARGADADRLSTPARHREGDCAAGPTGWPRAPSPNDPGCPTSGGCLGPRRPVGRPGGYTDDAAVAAGGNRVRGGKRGVCSSPTQR